MAYDDADYLESLSAIADGIEAEMKRIALWERERPAGSALASAQPFCYDTLLFHQWLQWVFLPRVRAITDDGEALPEASRILPYAEECLGQYEQVEDRLLFLVRSFDDLVALVNDRKVG